MCIICKQGRRKGGSSEPSAGRVAPARAARRAPGAPSAVVPGRPPFRSGKHAYQRSLPYWPGGCAPPGMREGKVPACRAWDPAEWAIYRIHCAITQVRLASHRCQLSCFQNRNSNGMSILSSCRYTYFMAPIMILLIFLITSTNICRVALLQTHQVILLSKLHKTFFGSFKPDVVFACNKNN